ncbi:MAG TPA: type I methionyl aminopeptidase [Candidatus Saccharimonadales bacterium]|jgi:methionyl aminopeptidase|nr:type I methionyl aminopeptidase [Candidatus Saccharimonadales bacterium]
MFTRVKTPQEIEDMRTSSKMLATILDLIRRTAKPGMNELDIADVARRELKGMGVTGPFLGYNGFPNVICISVNDKVVHGIPSDYEFQDGDVASFDFGVQYNGMVSDSAFTMMIGDSQNTEAKELIRTTERSLLAGIDVVKNGVRVGDIGAAIQAVLDAKHYGIVRELAGHGVGHQLHEDPDILNYGVKGSGSMLKAGMTVAIEPMANLGSEKVTIDADGWTIRTADHFVSAHFEHTILVTQDGAEILTQL